MHTSTRRSPWLALAVLATALAMVVLDGTIVGVALPVIMTDLRLNLTDAQWVNSLYSVVFAALLLTLGRWGDRHGRRLLLLAGVTLFVGGSIVAALAQSGGALIGARAIQGIGGAMILPSTLSTVNATFQGKARAAAFGVWGAVMSGAAALGPLLGGWLTQQFTWRWVFWVNVPIGALVIAAIVAWVPETRASHESQGELTDLPGALLSAMGFGLVVFGLIEGSDLGWWHSTGSLRLLGWTWPWQLSSVPEALVVGGALLAWFWLRERRLATTGRPGLLDVNLFSLPTFSWGNLTAGLVAVGEFALVFVLPLHLITVLRLSVLQSGLVLAGMALGAFASGAAARHLSARWGAPRVVVVGLALEVIGAAATAVLVSQRAPGLAVALALLPYGLGLGLAAAQLTSTVLRDVPIDQSGSGSATQSTVRQLGAAMGSALGGSALSIGLGTASVGRPDPIAFAQAASGAVWVAVAALVLGLLSAWRVQRAAQAS